MRGAYCISSSGKPKFGGGWNNQQLLKDCGLVPYLLHKNHGFRSVMVGNKCSDDYPYLKCVDGLELDFLPEDTTAARLAYVSAHAADIDLLILYGAYHQYIPLVEVYRALRPEGKIYLASDMNLGWARGIAKQMPSYEKFLKACDVIGASNTAVQSYMAQSWGVRVELIRNGFFGSVPDLPKRNIILTVGRIGTEQKRTEVLLNAFAAAARYLPEWSLRLVGSVEENFKPYIKLFFGTHPYLRGRVVFTGLIEDRATLLAEYARAKVFCLTSRFEGTPNAAAEALNAGCYMLTTDIEAANDITDAGNCGQIFRKGDTAALTELLKNVCRNQKLLSTGGRHAVAYGRREFDAEDNVRRLYRLLRVRRLDRRLL